MVSRSPGRTGGWRPAIVAALLGTLAGWLLIIVPATSASAHAFLLFTSPAADGAVPTSPAALTLTFDAPVTVSPGAVRVSGPDRRPVPLGAAVARGTMVTVPVTATLAVGTYTVDWQVTVDDGDTVAGGYRFAVGPQALDAGAGQASFTSPPAAPGLWPTTMLRWVLFAALATALGGLAGARLAARRAPKAPRAAPAPWIWQAALAGVVAAAGLALLVAGDGHLVRGLARPTGALTSRPGIVAVLELAVFAAACGAARMRFRPRWSSGALLVVVVAEAVRGHPQAAAPGWGGLLIGVHLVAIALWLGALVQVLRTALAWRDAPGRPAWRERRPVGLLRDLLHLGGGTAGGVLRHCGRARSAAAGPAARARPGWRGVGVALPHRLLPARLRTLATKQVSGGR